ncbi:MAG: ABC transporter permease [Holophagales bacterium]|nr:ABC transporter permease [Holophagales bacterium]
MFRHWFLLKELIKRDLQSRYVGSVLGWLWAIVQPLFQLFLFYFVFSTVLKISLVGERTDNFAAFLFCGLVVWIAVQEGIVRSSTALTDNATLVKKMSFPPEILVITMVVGGVINGGIATLVFAVVLAISGELGTAGLPVLLVALPLQIAMTLGLGLVLCTLHTLFRDTAQIVTMAMTGWFYFTPIVYPLGLVPEPYSDWIEWNPMTVLVSLYRQALLADELEWVPATGRLAVIAIAMLILGAWMFRRLRYTFVDEL